MDATAASARPSHRRRLRVQDAMTDDGGWTAGRTTATLGRRLLCGRCFPFVSNSTISATIDRCCTITSRPNSSVNHLVKLQTTTIMRCKTQHSERLNTLLSGIQAVVACIYFMSSYHESMLRYSIYTIRFYILLKCQVALMRATHKMQHQMNAPTAPEKTTLVYV